MGTGGAIVAGIIATKVIDAIWARAGPGRDQPQEPARAPGQGGRVCRDHRSRGGRRPDVMRPARPLVLREVVGPPARGDPRRPGLTASRHPPGSGSGAGRGPARAASPAGRPGARTTAPRARRGRPATPRPPARRPSRRSARAPPTVAATRASAAVIRISRTASAMTNGIDDVLQVPGLQSVASATSTPASRRRAPVRVGRARRELDPGQQRRDRRAGGADERLDVGVGEEGAVVDARGAELDGEPHARSRRRAGCRARAGRARHPVRRRAPGAPRPR